MFKNTVVCVNLAHLPTSPLLFPPNVMAAFRAWCVTPILLPPWRAWCVTPILLPPGGHDGNNYFPSLIQLSPLPTPLSTMHIYGNAGSTTDTLCDLIFKIYDIEPLNACGFFLSHLDFDPMRCNQIIKASVCSW